MPPILGTISTWHLSHAAIPEAALTWQGSCAAEKLSDSFLHVCYHLVLLQDLFSWASI